MTSMYSEREKDEESILKNIYDFSDSVYRAWRAFLVCFFLLIYWRQIIQLFFFLYRKTLFSKNIFYKFK